MERTEFNPGSLPDDLSRYIGKKTVVKLILEAIDTIGTDGLESGRGASTGKSFQPSMMLTLLTYCYGTGAFGSMEIDLNIRRDQMTRYLCAKNYPDVDAIRSFRRQNRSKIKECLALLLRRIWELRFCGEDAELIAGLSYARASLQRWTCGVPAPDFNRESETRISRAIRADSMALDN